MRQQKAQATDVTSERLAKGDMWDHVNPAKIDSSEQPIGRVRRFQSSQFDRMFKRMILTGRQHMAGDWYRTTHYRCRFDGAMISSYGERTSAGEPAYGLPRTQSQVEARRAWRDAREAFPLHMASFMDRFLLHDSLPDLHLTRRGKERMIDEMRDALDALADYLKVPGK